MNQENLDLLSDALSDVDRYAGTAYDCMEVLQSWDPCLGEAPDELKSIFSKLGRINYVLSRELDACKKKMANFQLELVFLKDELEESIKTNYTEVNTRLEDLESETFVSINRNKE